MKNLQFWSLQGLVPYALARDLQKALVEKRIQDEIPDTILFLEHQPVITRGRGLQYRKGDTRPRMMPFSRDQIPNHIQFEETERGGDLTYHGPGQLVVYPICKLDGQGFGSPQDVGAFLRKMESIVIEELLDLGILAQSNPEATGVWIDSGKRKIASLGVAVRKWVTFHGLALNISNDLAPFHWISPCGFSPDVMTRLQDWVPIEDFWRKEWEARLARQISAGSSPTIDSLLFSEALNRIGQGKDSEINSPELVERYHPHRFF